MGETGSERVVRECAVRDKDTLHCKIFKVARTGPLKDPSGQRLKIMQCKVSLSLTAHSLNTLGWMTQRQRQNAKTAKNEKTPIAKRQNDKTPKMQFFLTKYSTASLTIIIIFLNKFCHFWSCKAFVSVTQLLRAKSIDHARNGRRAALEMGS